MQIAIILLVILAVWLFVGPIVALVRAGEAKEEGKKTKDQLAAALVRLKALEKQIADLREGALLSAPDTEQKVALPPRREETDDSILEKIRRLEERGSKFFADDSPQPLPDVSAIPATPTVRKKLINYGENPPALPQATPPPLVTSQPKPPPEPKEPFSLEKFMGVKLFAWLGGIAMFFGVILFVKYAFEKNLIPPSMRIILGYVTGLGILTAGLVTHRMPRYTVLAQAFCATGVLILYGVTFAAHAVYHFPAFGNISTFVIMGVVTFGAFLISVRLNALVVAVLGMLGGFMTPILLSTGQDQVFGLFGYIALLDIGLLAVSRHGRWSYLTSWAAAGTALMQVGWLVKFFGPGDYDSGSATLIPMGIFLFFIALFMAGGWIGRKKLLPHAAGSVIGLAAVAMLFAFGLLFFSEVATREFLLYGFLLLVQLAVIVSVLARRVLAASQLVTALLAFLHLGIWTSVYLKPDNLIGTLCLYLVFGALHAVVPVILSRRMPERVPSYVAKSSPWFAPLVLVMMLLPFLNLDSVPLVIWFGILTANVMVMAIARGTGLITPVVTSLLLTMFTAGVWLYKLPEVNTSLFPFLGITTAFSAVFCLAGRWLLSGLPQEEGPKNHEQIAASALPHLSGLLPFILLILALLQLPVPNPTPVFTVALAMAALLSGLAIFGKQGPLVLVALVGVLAVEATWHLNHFNPAEPNMALTWYMGFYAAFLTFPFVLHKRCADLYSPWIAAALAGVGHFPLVFHLIKRGFPNDNMGLVPAAFAIPSLIAVFSLVKMFPLMDERQRSRLAWFGGVALLFITLIFPIQFERQWITVSWAMEGALLFWLYRRVPHMGLQFTGFVLLAISFVRLTLYQDVFNEYPRGETAILNWQLYTYGIVSASMFFAAKWFINPDNRWHPLRPQPIFYTAGGILLFLLLNIEIADYFTPPGDRQVAFVFGGNFARDMTYSIAWGLFSLGLLGLGFWSGTKHARYAAVGLLVVTLLKVFLHDLANIQNIFRIGALIGVAVIAFVASFLYQRFFDRPKS